MSRRKGAPKRKVSPDPVYGSVLVNQLIKAMMYDGKLEVAQKVVYSALKNLSQRAEKKSGDDSHASDNTSRGSSRRRRFSATESGSAVGVTVQLDQKQEAALELLERAIENIYPAVELRPRRVGGATYQIPVEVREERGLALAIRWLIAAARKRGEHGMPSRLSAEISDAVQKMGEAMKKSVEMLKNAKANQAFSHIRV